MFRLAAEWGAVEKALPTVRMLSGEKHRERVLTADEESRYFEASAVLARDLEDAYQQALDGIRAVQRGEQPRKPDAFLLRDAVRILLDCGLRPEECFRLRRENVACGKIEVLFGKTANARRRIPM
ncbi:MAG TPA: hypothetical protein VG273_27145, partial [Bryobacteraceae bacterium]|nr:hypothetical protein [Bryobacteraceae bacterium]